MGTSPPCSRAATTHASSRTCRRRTLLLLRRLSERYYRQGRRAERGAELAEAIDERERITSIFTPARSTTRTSDSRRTWQTRRAVRCSRDSPRRARRSTRSSCSSGSRSERSMTAAEALHADPALERWQYWLRSVPEVLPLHPDRARGEDHHREVGLRLECLGSPVRRASRSGPGRPGRGGDELRAGHGKALFER